MTTLLAGLDAQLAAVVVERGRLPAMTRVTSSKSGVWNGSVQSAGAFMWATETASLPVFTRPTCSAMILPPGTGMVVGVAMSSGTRPA